jgi:peptide/nickel transport system substrate-binding protein
MMPRQEDAMRRRLLVTLLITSAALLEPPGAGAQSKDDTLVYAVQSDIETYDMHNHILREGIVIGYHVFDNLVARDLKTRKIVPHLATSWKVIGERNWEFKLRKGVTFHNGDPFTAHTVKFNFDRVLNPENKLPQRGNHVAIIAVEVVDDFTVRFKTKDPYPLMLERLTQLQMLSERVVKDKGNEWLATHAVGTGPYKLVSWKPKQEHLWERHEAYWGPKPAFKYVRVRIIPELATQIAELVSGGVDVIKAVPPDQMDVINKSGRARTSASPILRTAFLQLDQAGRSGKSPVQDARVRQALNHAVDADGIIKHVLLGLGDRVATVVNPMAFGYDPALQPYRQDVAKAKKLLAEAGYPQGFEMRFRTGLYVVEPGVAQTNEAIVADLAKVGVKATQNLINDTGPYVTQVREGKAGPMFNWSWGYYSVFDADAILWDLLKCGENFSYYCNKDLDKLIEAGRASINAAERADIYKKAQKMLFDDAAHVFKWGLRGVWGISNRIEYSAPLDEIDRMFIVTPRGKKS